MTIYADCNATFPLLPKVKDYLSKRFDEAPLANPNSIHSLGQQVARIYENSRASIALHLGSTPNQLIFNSGASEGIAQVFHSLLNKGERSFIVVGATEHPAILESAKSYLQKGYEIITIPVQSNGVIDLPFFQQWFDQFGSQTALVAIMAANNETGVLHPYEEIGKICQKRKVPFLCDTTQLIGKIPFHFNNSSIDFAVYSGHKLGALPGTGGLLVRDETLLIPLIHGGGQEAGHRSGTQNYLGQESVAVALDELINHFPLWNRIQQKRDEFITKLRKEFSSILFFGEEAPKLPGTLMFSYPGIHGQVVQIELESHGIFVTTSSACSDNDPHPSHVLKAMGINDSAARGAIRMSFSPFTKDEEFDAVLTALIESYHRLSKIASY